MAAVAAGAVELGLRVVTAESLTAGGIAGALASGPRAATWFAGGLVAYQESTKSELLGVVDCPVVSRACVEQMAYGALNLFGADVAVASTGVGGPEPSEGKPPGTLHLAVADRSRVVHQELLIPGPPSYVVAASTRAGVGQLAAFFVRER